MVDTVRTRSALEALLATVSVTVDPQDLRDILASTELRNPAGEQTGGSYTFTLADADQTVVFNSGSAQAITIPTNAAVPFEIGTKIRCFRKGAGLPTISAGAASPTEVTLRLPTGIRPNRFMGVRAINTADQTAQNYTAGANLPFNSEQFDTDGFHDTVTNNSRLTIPSGLGIKRVDVLASARLSALTSSVWCFLALSKGGTAAFDGAGSALTDIGTTTNTFAVGGYGIDVAAGNYIEARLQVQTDTSITVVAARTHLSLEVTEIDPVGSIAYRYGWVELEKIGTNEWIIGGPALG